MMRSASREAVAALAVHREEIVTAGVSSEQLSTLAGELYSVAAVLVAQPRLRHLLSDPATEPRGRGELVAGLFADKVGQRTIQIVQAAVSQRWSSSWDLTDAIERVGDDCLFAAAESLDVMDEVEDQLFRFGRILLGSPDLAVLLDEHSTDSARRVGLLDAVLAGKAHPITQQLLVHAVAADRKRTVIFAVDELLDSAAARRDRFIARVTSAVELTDEQRQRLEATLSSMYGRPITVRVALEPSLRGGLVVRVGDEIIDGSVATRLLQVRSALAG